jgi:hypothetical protein
MCNNTTNILSTVFILGRFFVLSLVKFFVSLVTVNWNNFAYFFGKKFCIAQNWGKKTPDFKCDTKTYFVVQKFTVSS